MAASNIDRTGGKSSGSIGNGNGNSNNNGSIGNAYNNSGSIGNSNGNGNAVHDNYGTVHNMFIVLNICPGSGADADADADDGDQDQERGAAPMVARVLGVIGVATSSIATGATAFKYTSPRRVVNHGRELAYLFAMVVVFLAGLAEVGAAFWVSVDNRNRYGASRKIVRAAIVLLVLTVGLGCFAIVFKN